MLLPPSALAGARERLIELERAQRGREQMQMQTWQLPIDLRLLADIYGMMPDLCVVPGARVMTWGPGGDGGECGFVGSGGYAAVGDGVSPAGTDGWASPAGEGVLPPVGGGFSCVANGYSPADKGCRPVSDQHPPAGELDFVF